MSASPAPLFDNAIDQLARSVSRIETPASALEAVRSIVAQTTNPFDAIVRASSAVRERQFTPADHAALGHYRVRNGAYDRAIDSMQIKAEANGDTPMLWQLLAIRKQYSRMEAEASALSERIDAEEKERMSERDRGQLKKEDRNREAGVRAHIPVSPIYRMGGRHV